MPIVGGPAGMFGLADTADDNETRSKSLGHIRMGADGGLSGHVDLTSLAPWFAQQARDMQELAQKVDQTRERLKKLVERLDAQR